MHQLSYSYLFLGVLIFSVIITGTLIITSIGPSHTKKHKFKLLTTEMKYLSMTFSNKII